MGPTQNETETPRTKQVVYEILNDTQDPPNVGPKQDETEKPRNFTKHEIEDMNLDFEP